MFTKKGGYIIMILFYLIAGAFAALMLAGAVCVVFRAGENENICNYNRDRD
jgi:hypothetical protein